MILKRLTVYIVPILFSAFFEAIFYIIDYWFYIVIGLLIVLLVYLKVLIKAKLLSEEFLGLSIMPFLLFFTVLSFLLLIDSELLRHVIIGIYTLLFLLYLDMIFLYLYRPWQYKSSSLENISALLSIIIFFLTAISLNAFLTLLNLPVYYVVIGLLVIVSVMLYQYFWVHKITANIKYLYIVVISIIMTEFFLAVTFLPMNFYVISIILTIIFYLVLGLAKAKLLTKINNKMVLRYLVIGTVLLLMIVFTSPWT